jgi:hypothetical protein
LREWLNPRPTQVKGEKYLGPEVGILSEKCRDRTKWFKVPNLMQEKHKGSITKLLSNSFTYNLSIYYYQT